MTATRHWCGRGQYEGKESFVFGSVDLPADAMAHEVDSALLALWASLFPFDPPRLVAVPGIIIFQQESE